MISTKNYFTAFEWTFPALTGVAALAYFLQNCVVALIKPQRYPENNVSIDYINIGSLIFRCCFFVVDSN